MLAARRFVFFDVNLKAKAVQFRVAAPRSAFLPVWSLWAVGVTISFIELIAGALVILGLRTRDALICVLIIVTFGHFLPDALFTFSGHVIPRLALLLFVLLCPREDDHFSLDHLLTGK